MVKRWSCIPCKISFTFSSPNTKSSGHATLHQPTIVLSSSNCPRHSKTDDDFETRAPEGVSKSFVVPLSPLPVKNAITPILANGRVLPCVDDRGNGGTTTSPDNSQKRI